MRTSFGILLVIPKTLKLLHDARAQGEICVAIKVDSLNYRKLALATLCMFGRLRENKHLVDAKAEDLAVGVTPLDIQPHRYPAA